MTTTAMPSDSQQLRILHLTAGSDAGGVSRYLHDLCTAMHQRGHEVAIAGERGAWHDLFANAHWPWIELPFKGGLFSLARCERQLREHLRLNPVDVLHVHYRRPALVARRIARDLHMPILFTLHLTELSLRGWNRWLSDFGDHTHVASQDASDWLQQQAGLTRERITVIPHGIDPARFPLADRDTQLNARRLLRLPSDAVLAAFVGRFDTPKNEAWMLDVAVAARTQVPNLHVVMIGQGPNEPALHHRIRRDGLESTVHLLPYGDPLPVYEAADALLLPSEREGFSLVCAEAMSVGRPIFRTRTAGCRETVIEGVTGRTSTVNREAFVAGAVEFLKDRAALATMGQSAARHVREHLTFDLQVQRTLDLYRRLTPRRVPVTGEGR